MSEKRILLICPRFFGYQEAIKIALERLGFTVDWFDDRPSATPLIKALVRLRPEIIKPLSEAYFNNILKQTQARRYEQVIVVKGEALSFECVLSLREMHPESRFAYYTWDSLRNFKSKLETIKLFDKAYSFDLNDSEVYPEVCHLSLFYMPAYACLAAKQAVLDIDYLFLGSVHSDRYVVMDRIARAVRTGQPTAKIETHFFYQSKWVFFLKKLIDSNFRKIPWPQICWRAIEEQAALDFVARSKVIVDIHHPGQTGLTMRTIESIGAKKKLITTNPDVRGYDFFSPENILVVDRDNPIVPIEFIEQGYVELAPEIYARYSLDSWVSELIA